MKKTTLYRKATVITLGTALVIGLLAHAYLMGQQRVSAVGDLTITYNDAPLSDPIFDVQNMLPGDCESRSIAVDNGAPSASLVAVRSDNEINPQGLASVLAMTISEAATDLYGGTVAQFFVDSQGINGVPLSTLPGGDSTSYTFEVCMDLDAGNEYQNTFVQFDLVFGEIMDATPTPTIQPTLQPTPTPPLIALPAECSHLQGIITSVIEGTEGNDRIRGTNASELILAKGGDDDVDGAGGHDCIVGGTGNDDLDGGTGNDVIIGGPGSNKLDGGQGDDLIYGGDGDEEIDGGQGNDRIFGGAGNDEIDAGNGNDYVEGGAGDDEIDGGSGDDQLFGQEGDDTIKGGSGNDFIDGGPGNDTIEGSAGTDTCINGESVKSCEL